jgi:hypothetical protein
MTWGAWTKPELIVVSRGGQQENVLTGCKGSAAHTSFLNRHDSCHSDAPACTTLCSSIHVS